MTNQPQMEVLDGFRRGEVQYDDIPAFYEKYTIKRWGDIPIDVGRNFTALRVVCSIEHWNEDFATQLEGVVVQTSERGIYVAVPDWVLQAFQDKTIKTARYISRSLRRRPCVYDLEQYGVGGAWLIEKHTLATQPDAFTWYDVGCMSIARQEVDLLLQHPLVKQFLE